MPSDSTMAGPETPASERANTMRDRLAIGESDRLAGPPVDSEDTKGLYRQRPIAFWSSILILALGLAGSLLLSTGTADLAYRLGELFADATFIALVAAIIYGIVRIFRRTSSSLRATFFLVASVACAIRWLASGEERFEQLRGNLQPIASALSESLENVIAKLQQPDGGQTPGVSKDGAVTAQNQRVSPTAQNGAVPADPSSSWGT